VTSSALCLLCTYFIVAGFWSARRCRAGGREPGL